MKVKKLIELLHQYDPDLEVLIGSWQGQCVEVIDEVYLTKDKSIIGCGLDENAEFAVLINSDIYRDQLNLNNLSPTEIALIKDKNS